MSLSLIVGVLIVVALLGYLIYALFHAEDF
ncbi:K(+)-transporting ATPase subunit F [Budviciaceae bacterium BWR-B9]|uniref:K(+)-transporting ATPase subunit F n=1 Tax=Limnobaculum allomyrinae TaxID=2791986 RepID=A0ABS1ITZ3_9GAMM|nr:K(+)-transporting ATPase subunit F [Limnobaculum allomyrinae]MBV7692975.1 K(+)-transporting ATPase subunit F [Limnobaculum sp. M2-1]